MLGYYIRLLGSFCKYKCLLQLFFLFFAFTRPNLLTQFHVILKTLLSVQINITDNNITVFKNYFWIFMVYSHWTEPRPNTRIWAETGTILDNRSRPLSWLRCNVKAYTNFHITHLFPVPVPVPVWPRSEPSDLDIISCRKQFFLFLQKKPLKHPLKWVRNPVLHYYKTLL